MVPGASAAPDRKLHEAVPKVRQLCEQDGHYQPDSARPEPIAVGSTTAPNTTMSLRRWYLARVDGATEVESGIDLRLSTHGALD